MAVRHVEDVLERHLPGQCHLVFGTISPTGHSKAAMCSGARSKTSGGGDCEVGQALGLRRALSPPEVFMPSGGPAGAMGTGPRPVAASQAASGAGSESAGLRAPRRPGACPTVLAEYPAWAKLSGIFLDSVPRTKRLRHYRLRAAFSVLLAGSIPEETLPESANPTIMPRSRSETRHVEEPKHTWKE
jgi:hypothetical protein